MGLEAEFKQITFGPYSFQSFEPWHGQGFVHGFIGKSGNFSNANLPFEKARFLQAFGARDLVLLEQVHGKNCLDLRSAKAFTSPADSMLLSASQKAEKIAYGIKTADCLPIIVRSGGEIALIHAGWRGLASGIIEEVLKNFPSNQELQIVIGPCAGAEKYEVGFEVIEALGKSAQYIKNPNNPVKFLLALSATAQKIIFKAVPDAQVFASKICTISNIDFHSCRRDGASFGSNLAFVVC